MKRVEWTLNGRPIESPAAKLIASAVLVVISVPLVVVVCVVVPLVLLSSSPFLLLAVWLEIRHRRRTS